MDPYVKVSIPPATDRHLLTRMSTGYTPSIWEQLRNAGGARAWFEAQLNPSSITESQLASALPSWFPDLADDPATKWSNGLTGAKSGWAYCRDLQALTVMRRAYSNRTVLEMMVDFWSNHLHIPGTADRAWVHRASYDDLLRSHALGRFDELLPAATLHPAMVLYLDTWRSKKGAPNENHGRELLELHTVGRVAGYTEAMVKDAGIILSGYTATTDGSWSGFYDPDRHTTGPVKVLGFAHANTAPDGQAMTHDFLVYLARHPATARTIAHKLAVKFVSDTPSSGLVNRLARVYLANATDIRPVLRALVAHKEFKASAGLKIRTQVEDLVATIRSLDVQASRPGGSGAYALAVASGLGSPELYQWPRPDGAPEAGAAHASASRMLSSFRAHWNHAGGYWPREGVVYRTPADWIPEGTIRVDDLVDHLSRTFHGQAASPALVTLACQATALEPDAMVSATHPIGSWLGVRLIAALLDTPQHMTR